MLNLVHLNSQQTLFLAVLIVEHYRKKGEEALLIAEDDAKEYIENSGLTYGEEFFIVSDVKKFIGQPLNIVMRQHPACMKQARRLLNRNGKEGVVFSTYEDGFAIGYLQPMDFSHLLKDYGLKARHSLSFDRLNPIAIPDDVPNEMVESSNLHAVRKSYPSLYKEAERVMASLEATNIKEITVVAMRPIGSETFHRGRYQSTRPTRTLVRIVKDLLPYCDTQDFILYRQDKRDARLTKGAIAHLNASKPHFSMLLDDHLTGGYSLDALIYLLTQSEIKVSFICFNTSFPLIYTKVGSNNQFIVGINLEKIDSYDFKQRAKGSFMEVHDRMMNHLSKLENKTCAIEPLAEGLFRIYN